ncbi:7141_t:CDS:1, partial [Funneliformis geosporum]
NALHFITILMKSSLQVPSIPNIINHTFQNPKGIDPSNIIIKLDLQFMKDLNITYHERKRNFTNLFGLHETHEERTER